MKIVKSISTQNFFSSNLQNKDFTFFKITCKTIGLEVPSTKVVYLYGTSSGP